MSLVTEFLDAAPASSALVSRVPLFGTGINALDMRQTVATVLPWIEEPFRRCRYVVTPNVDHVVKLQSHIGLQQAYADADLVLADGWPIVLASRWLGCPLPERVPGSDLVPALFAAGQRMTAFLLGAAPGVAEQAAAQIHRRWPCVQVTGTHSPPLGFEKDPAENQRILRLLEGSQPDLLIVGLGAPKQELWVHAHRAQMPVKVALCVGATIDFLAGRRRRAPRWMRRSGLEWVHRLASEPRRLARRYAHDAMIFPTLVWRQRRLRRRR